MGSRSGVIFGAPDGARAVSTAETLLVETSDELETHRKLYDGDVCDEKVWQNEVHDVLCQARSSYRFSSFVFW